MGNMQVFTLENLTEYDGLFKKYISDVDKKSLKTVSIMGNILKFYDVVEPVGQTEPKYELILPEADVSNLITKMSGATVGNVVVSTADGQVSDGGVKLTDLAKKAEVEAVSGIANANKAVIEAINHVDTGILKTAQTYTDTKIGTMEQGKTVVQLIDEAKTSATYNDAQVKADIKANTEAINAHKTAIDTKVTTLVGSDTNKSVRTIANEELAAQLLSGRADADFKTLQDLATWLENHPESVAAINTSIADLKKLIGTIPVDATSANVVAYIKELVDTEKTRATGIENGLDTRLQTVENAIGTSGAVEAKIATAKQEAIDVAATDATTKANRALADAKVYADGLFEPIPSDFIKSLFA